MRGQFFITEMKKHRIHVAAETTGYIEGNIFRRLAPMFDLLLFDVKHYDPQKHYEGTGVYNTLIIENLSWSVEKGLDVLPRIPVIPGFNGTLEDASQMADLLIKIGLQKVQLLPFHQFGERKYELLSRDYAFKNVKALHSEDLREYQQVLVKKGMDCFI